MSYRNEIEGVRRNIPLNAAIIITIMIIETFIFCRFEKFRSTWICAVQTFLFAAGTFSVELSYS